MPIQTQCPHCSKRGSAPDGSVGKNAKCQGCNRVYKIEPILPPPAPSEPSRKAVINQTVILAGLVVLAATGFTALGYAIVTKPARDRAHQEALATAERKRQEDALAEKQAAEARAEEEMKAKVAEEKARTDAVVASRLKEEKEKADREAEAKAEQVKQAEDKDRELTLENKEIKARLWAVSYNNDYYKRESVDAHYHVIVFKLTVECVATGKTVLVELPYGNRIENLGSLVNVLIADDSAERSRPTQFGKSKLLALRHVELAPGNKSTTTGISGPIVPKSKKIVISLLIPNDDKSPLAEQLEVTKTIDLEKIPYIRLP